MCSFHTLLFPPQVPITVRFVVFTCGNFGGSAAEPGGVSVSALGRSKTKSFLVKSDHARLGPSIFRLLPLHLESESFWGDERGVRLEEELVVDTCDTCDGQQGDEGGGAHLMMLSVKSQGLDGSIRPLTSDLKSSDFALAESAPFICPCSSSSLLVEGVLPFDNERTAGGAMAARRKEFVA